MVNYSSGIQGVAFALPAVKGVSTFFRKKVLTPLLRRQAMSSSSLDQYAAVAHYARRALPSHAWHRDGKQFETATAGYQADDAPGRPLAQIEYTTVLIPCSV